MTDQRLRPLHLQCPAIASCKTFSTADCTCTECDQGESSPLQLRQWLGILNGCGLNVSRCHLSAGRAQQPCNPSISTLEQPSQCVACSSALQVTHCAGTAPMQSASTCSQIRSIVALAPQPAPQPASARQGHAAASQGLQTALRAAVAARLTCRRMLHTVAHVTPHARVAASAKPVPVPVAQVRTV